jgi:amidase
VSVAAGLAFGALGSDTGGSIRFPSASCGLVGIKPTYGRVSKAGAFPLADSLDHIGPMTRCVADAARMLQVVAGHDPTDPASLLSPVPNYAATMSIGVTGLRIGVDWGYVETGVDVEVAKAVRDAIALFEGLGAQTVEIVMPSGYRSLIQGWALTCGVECAHAHREYYPERHADYGDALAALIRLGQRTTGEEYAQLEGIRRQFAMQLDGVLDHVDAVIMPSMPGLPPALESMDERQSSQRGVGAEMITFTAPFDYSGHPTISLPAGLANNGLPKSIQLVGERLGEAGLIRMGAAFEEALGLDQRPLA